MFNGTKNALKFNSQPTGMLVYHNTIIDRAGFDVVYGYTNSTFKNNLFMGRDNTSEWGYADTGTNSPNTTIIDHNGFYDFVPTRTKYFHWTFPTHSFVFDSLSAMQTASNFDHAPAILTSYAVFENGAQASLQNVPLPEALDLRIASGSAADSSGVDVPQFSSLYVGENPSLGAYEREQPRPTHGRRLSGIPQAGKAGDFDGINDYAGSALVFGFPLVGGSATFCAMVRPEGYSEQQIYFEQRGTNAVGGMSWYLTAGGKIAFATRGNEQTTVVSTNGSYVPNAWHALAVSVRTIGSDLEVRFYVNGKLTDIVDVTGRNLYVSDQPAFVGARDLIGSQDRWFNGQIDELVLFDRELSAEEIGTYTNGGLGKYQSGTDSLRVAGWHFDSGATSTPDFTGSGYNLTLSGSTLVDSSVARQ